MVSTKLQPPASLTKDSRHHGVCLSHRSQGTGVEKVSGVEKHVRSSHGFLYGSSENEEPRSSCGDVTGVLSDGVDSHASSVFLTSLEGPLEL